MSPPPSHRLHFLEHRTAERVHTACGCHRVESHCTEDVPCRHLTTVLVAAQPFRSGLVEVRHYPVDKCLRLPRLAVVIIEVTNVMARFVSVRVEPDQSGFIRGAPVSVISELCEKRESSRKSNLSRPPRSAVSPATSCGTSQRYCHAFPSVYSGCFSVEKRGLNGDTHDPSVFFPRKKPDVDRRGLGSTFPSSQIEPRLHFPPSPAPSDRYRNRRWHTPTSLTRTPVPCRRGHNRRAAPA